MAAEGENARVRAYRPGDRGGCLAVFDTNVPRFFRDGERAEFAAFLDDLPGPFLVLEEGHDGRIVAGGGWAVVPEAARADLCWGMVRRERHGEGLGRRLTRARLRGAVSDPTVREVRLSTSQLTTGFYEGLGFRVVAVEEDGYGPGLDRCDMVADADAVREGTGRGA